MSTVLTVLEPARRGERHLPPSPDQLRLLIGTARSPTCLPLRSMSTYVIFVYMR